MRHAKLRYSLNRSSSWRKATVLSLARNLLIRQSINTTKTRALAVRPLAEKLITLAKENTLEARRRAYRILCDHRLVALLFSDFAARFQNKTGGYTKILNLGNRRGDNARMVSLEFTEIIKKAPRVPKKIKAAKSESSVEVEQSSESKKPKSQQVPKLQTETAVKEKPPVETKPKKNFLGGLRQIFKKERGSLQSF